MIAGVKLLHTLPHGFHDPGTVRHQPQAISGTGAGCHQQVMIAQQ